MRQSKGPEHQSWYRQRFSGHSRRFTGQGNVLPPRERLSGWQMPDLAQDLLVRSEDEQPTGGILDEREDMRHIQFAEPGYTLALYHSSEELFSHVRGAHPWTVKIGCASDGGLDLSPGMRGQDGLRQLFAELSLARHRRLEGFLCERLRSGGIHVVVIDVHQRCSRGTDGADDVV